MSLSTEQREWLTLTLVPGVGATHFIHLLARFGTPREVLRASEAALAEVVGPKLGQRLRTYQEVVDVDAQARALDQYQARLITMEDPEYPPHLAEIYDPPLVLFVRGDLYEADQYAVALVGTRKPTPYGIRMAERIAGDLARRGLTVVSGMATGVDAAAHQGAIDAGGRTLAVLGCGVDIVYPAENAELMHHIIQHGCVVSPFPMGVKPSKGHFPHRNRFISGLSLGTLVIEAPPGSGSLITARHAAEQGREVFALPGPVGQRNSMGPHALIREGAKLVETAEDIVVELEVPAAARQPAAISNVENTEEPSELEFEEPVAPKIPDPPKAPAVPPAPPPPGPRPGPRPVLSALEKDVLSVLSVEGSFVDEIAMACRIPVSEALSSLTLLELKGMVRQFSGKRFAPR
jgi:DNA processing protein